MRAARSDKNLTLRQVEVMSRGVFKASSLACYERAERAISLDRFCLVARIYGLSPEGLLGRVLDHLNPEGRAEVVVDLAGLPKLRSAEGRVVAEFVHDVKARRGDYLADVITLRSGDLEILSASTNREPRELLKRLRPVVRPVPRPVYPGP